MDNLLLFSHRHKIAAILLLGLFTLILGSGLSNLRIDTSLDLLLDKESADYQRYLSAMDTFGSDNTTVFYIKDRALFTPEKLAVLQEMADELDALEQVERVDSLFSLTSIRDRDGWLESKIILDTLPFDQQEADAALDDALYSPLLSGNVISEAGDVLAFTVSVRPPNHPDEKLNDGVHKAFETIIAKYQEHFEELFQAGYSRTSNDLRTYMVKDMGLLAPLSLVVLVLGVGLLLRNVTMSLLPVFSSVMSVIWTFGFLGHVDIPVNLLTAMLPPLLLVIGATEDIHLSSAYLEAYDEPGIDDRPAAIEYMAKHMSLAVILTALTTSIGFLSNLYSNLEIIQHFAIAASFGIVANAVITFLGLPILLGLFGPKPKQEDREERKSLVDVLAYLALTRLHEPTVTRPRLTAAVTGFLLLGCVVLFANVSVNTDPMKYFPDDSLILEHNEKITSSLSGVLVFYVILDAGYDGAFLDPERLDQLHAFVDHINTADVFDRAMSHSEHLSLVHREMFEGDASRFRPPESRDLVDQFLMFFQRSDLEPYVSGDGSSANVVVRYSIYGSEESLQAINALKLTAKDLFGDEIDVSMLGKYVLVNQASGQLVANEIKAMASIVAVIFLAMWVLFGSWRAGLVSLIPNLIPILMTFGVMVLLGIEINPATAMVASIAIGVAIDDTTHLLTRFNAESKLSDDVEATIHKVVRMESVPIVVSSLALGAGFLVLYASEFTLIKEFGLLAAIAMVFALGTEFIITPLLMRNLQVVNLWELVSEDLPMQQLQESPLFADMSFYQIKRLVLLSKRQQMHAGETIINRGDTGREMYMIIDGKARVTLDAEPGEIAQEYELTAGGVIGEVAFVANVTRTATVTVEEDVDMLVLDHISVATRLKNYPAIENKLNYNIANILGNRLADVIA